MVGIGYGKVYRTARGRNYYFYLPYHVVQDTAFPFKEKELIQVRIEGDRVILEKAPPNIKPKRVGKGGGRRGKADRA